MPTATVTPGYVFSNNELVTYPKLNALGLPTVSVTIPSSINPQNYLRNGNFYIPYWNNPSGVSCPIGVETTNAQFWTVNPSGAAVTYSQSNTVQNTHSLVSAQITGATSVTTVNFSQTIPGDLSDTLNATVSFSGWIYNNTGVNLTPVLIISSANSYNNFTNVTQIASQNLQTITATQWGYETGTVNLTGLSNVNNGLKITIQFPSGALASGTQIVNLSQFMLVLGSTPITYIDDFTLFPPQQEQAPSYVATMNGDMQVWQRNTSFTSLGGSATYTADRWKFGTSGGFTGKCTVSRQAAGITGTINYPDTEYCLRIAVTTTQSSLASGDYAQVTQFIEQQIARSLYDNPSSFSLLLRSSITGTFCVSLCNNNGGASNESYIMECPISTANAWQRFTFNSIPVMPTGSGTWGTSDTDRSYQISINCACGTTLQGANGGWQSGNFLADSNQTNLFATNGATLDITLVQHQSGNLCTPFQWIPFDQELARCRRYYEKTYSYGSPPGQTGGGGYAVFNCSTASSCQGNWFYKVSKRTSAPSVVIYNWSTGASNSSVWDVTAAASVGSSAVQSTQTEDSVDLVSFTSGGTIGHLIAIHATSDADF